jgi:hypothetical protein
MMGQKQIVSLTKSCSRFAVRSAVRTLLRSRETRLAETRLQLFPENET